jgi:hypothetical protein
MVCVYGKRVAKDRGQRGGLNRRRKTPKHGHAQGIAGYGRQRGLQRMMRSAALNLMRSAALNLQDRWGRQHGLLPHRMRTVAPSASVMPENATLQRTARTCQPRSGRVPANPVPTGAPLRPPVHVALGSLCGRPVNDACTGVQV